MTLPLLYWRVNLSDKRKLKRITMITDGKNLAADPPPMFTPFTLRDLTVPNRVVMSPMCMYSAEDLNGSPNDFHVVHLGSRAMGGAGLVFTEMTQISPV